MLDLHRDMVTLARHTSQHERSLHMKSHRSLLLLLLLGIVAATTPTSRANAFQPTSATALGAILRAPVDLPPGPVAIEIARFVFEAESQLAFAPLQGTRVLAVEAGQLDLQTSGSASYAPFAGTADPAWEQVSGGQAITLAPGDQLVVASPGDLATSNRSRAPATLLVTQFASADSGPEATATQDDTARVARTILVAGELPNRAAGIAEISLHRAEIAAGAVDGPSAYIVCPMFVAAETGTLVMDLLAGTGTVWQQGVATPLAPSDDADPELLLTPGVTALLEPVSEALLANPGADPLVTLRLCIRAPLADGGDGREPADDQADDAVSDERLLEETLGWGDIPPAVDRLAVSRVTLAPGETATATNGAHLFALEAGALTVQEYTRTYLLPTATANRLHEDAPAGPAIAYDVGFPFRVAARWGVPPTITNDGTVPAVALVVSLVPDTGSGIEVAFPGWTEVDPLASARMDYFGPVFGSIGGAGGSPIIVTLDRIAYDTGAQRGFPRNASHLLVVESGTLEITSQDMTISTTAAGTPQPRLAYELISLGAGDAVQVPIPGGVIAQNVASGATISLIVTISFE
jgi:hypothetical protein